MPGGLGPAMRLPASRFFLHHSVTAASNGAAAVRKVAGIGVNRFGRASYSYAVTPDGRIYEMQGNRVGTHTRGYNSTASACVLVGNYENTRISNAQINSVAWLYRTLRSRGWLRSGAPILGHRDVGSTLCPGRHAYSALPTIRARATSGSTPPPSSPSPSPRPSPSPPKGAFMSLSNAEQRELLNRVRKLPNTNQVGLKSIEAGRFVRDEKEPTAIRRVVRAGWKSGDPVVHTDFISSWIEMPQDSPADRFLKMALQSNKRPWRASRLPADIYDHYKELLQRRSNPLTLHQIGLKAIESGRFVRDEK